MDLWQLSQAFFLMKDRCIGYWIHKSALCTHILHEFVVLLEVKPSAKPQTSVPWGTLTET